MNAQAEALLAGLYHPELKAIDLGLARMEALLAALGNPQRRLPPVIHVAGTNGKGSLVAYLQAIFGQAGLSAHRYISPHLVRFNERIVLAGEEIPDAELIALLEQVRAATRTHPATFFEATTAAAFLAFAAHPADVLLLEVGLGGRLDATNVVEPLLTAITPVSMDHAEYLGQTVALVAREKAGILKPGVPCVLGPQTAEAAQEISAVAGRCGATLYPCGVCWNVEAASAGGRYESAVRTVEFSPSLAGEHQIFNAGTAIACIDNIPHLGISDEAIRRGIAGAVWPARLQRLQGGALSGLLPPGAQLWLDGGHNPGAGAALGAWAARSGLPLVLVCGMVRGKDTAGFLAPLAAHAQALIAVDIPGEEASRPAGDIAQAGAALGMQAQCARDLPHALELALAAVHGPARVLICGSLYLAGKVLSLER